MVVVVADFVKNKRDKSKRRNKKEKQAKGLLPVGAWLYQVKNEKKKVKNL